MRDNFFYYIFVMHVTKMPSIAELSFRLDVYVNSDCWKSQFLPDRLTDYLW